MCLCQSLVTQRFSIEPPCLTTSVARSGAEERHDSEKTYVTQDTALRITGDTEVEQLLPSMGGSLLSNKKTINIGVPLVEIAYEWNL